MEAAETAGFDVLITVDQNIPDQQNLTGRSISVLILCGITNRLRDLEPLIPDNQRAIVDWARRGGEDQVARVCTLL